MKKIYFLAACAALLLLSVPSLGQTYTTIADGVWGDDGIWAGGTAPPYSPTDSVFINHHVDYGNNVVLVFNYLEITVGGKLYSDRQKEIRVHQFTTLVNRDSVGIQNLENSGTVHNYSYFFTAAFTNKGSGVIHNHTAGYLQSSGTVDNNGTLINDGTVWSPHIFVNNHGSIMGDGGTYLVDANFIDNAGASIGCSGPGGIYICTSWGDTPANVVISSGTIDTSCVTICGHSWGNSGLPVELVSFEARTDGPNAVLLEWQTATEINNYYFEILLSIDGIEWVSSGKVYSKNPNSTELLSYTFEDNLFLQYNSKAYYYRLKQVDLDGQFEMLPIVGVVPEKVAITDVVVFPNPASDYVNISWQGFDLKGAVITATLYDHMGRTISIEEIDTKTTNMHRLNTDDVSAGIYYLDVMGEGINFQKQIVIERN